MLMATRYDASGNQIQLDGAGGLGFSLSVGGLSSLASGAASVASSIASGVASGATAIAQVGCGLVTGGPKVGGATQAAATIGCNAVFPNTKPATAPVMPTTPALKLAGQNVTAKVGQYAGTIARYNTTRRVWSIYKPGSLSGAVSVGLGDACLFGHCGLGAAGDVTPAAPGAKVAELAAKPAESADGGTETDGPVWYKNWKTYAIAAGVVGVVGGGWYLLK